MTVPLSQDFNAFLFAPIGDDANGLPLTLLSALARLGIDPWDEAASLAKLSEDSATQRLASLLGDPSAGAAPHDDSATITIARRLVALLHRLPRSKVIARDSAPFQKLVSTARRPGPAIYFLAAVIFLFLCQWAFG